MPEQTRSSVRQLIPPRIKCRSKESVAQSSSVRINRISGELDGRKRICRIIDGVRPPRPVL